MTTKQQWTRTWSKRTLARMPGGPFVETEDGPDEVRAHLQSGEHILGVYTPADAADMQKVFVAELGVVFFDETWRYIPYASIAQVSVDLTGIEKMAAEKAQILRDDGTRFILSVVGGGPHHRDVFEFVRFLLRVADAHRPPRDQ